MPYPSFDTQLNARWVPCSGLWFSPTDRGPGVIPYSTLTRTPVYVMKVQNEGQQHFRHLQYSTVQDSLQALTFSEEAFKGLAALDLRPFRNCIGHAGIPASGSPGTAKVSLAHLELIASKPRSRQWRRSVRKRPQPGSRQRRRSVRKLPQPGLRQRCQSVRKLPQPGSRQRRRRPSGPCGPTAWSHRSTGCHPPAAAGERGQARATAPGKRSRHCAVAAPCS